MILNEDDHSAELSVRVHSENKKRLGNWVRNLVPILLLILSSSSPGQKAAQEALVKLVSSKIDVKDYRRTADPRIVDRRGLWHYIGNISELYLNNRFQFLATVDYVSRENDRKITFDLCQFENPSKCFALYSNLRLPEYRFLEIGTEAYLLGDTLIFKKDRYLGRLVSPFLEADSVLVEFARKIAAKIIADAPFPEELRYFPAGLVPRSEKLALSEVFGGESLGDLYSALYRITDDTVTFSFSLAVPIPMVDAVDRFLEGGIIVDYVTERDYQAIFGTHPEKGNIYAISRKSVLCVMSGFGEKQVAKELADRFFENIQTK